ncbi:hypothetical protein JTE90_020404 [Oedothorax gibbosus]|uniref:Uncharacterized protein n=1 Tax=Oedothorax gibbosus TaxID=931172 RepID=A0AAV6UFP0_9ARAC|nr:hypothetical protein JTE90_020404 [Oedothorax gibbosus]
MLEKGAYYNSKNRNGDTPMEVTKKSDIKYAFTLVKQLFISVKRNKRGLLKALIKEGAILNAKRKDDSSLLHYAAYKGLCDIVNDLLMNGANPNIEGRGKCTPLHYASKYGHLNVVRSLLSHGARHDFQSGSGKTPLDYSTQFEVTELLSLIQKSFMGVLNGDAGFLETLKNLREIESVRCVMKTRNKDNKLLITFAIRNDFPKVKQLKQLLEEDLTLIYSEAFEYIRLGKYSESLKLYENVLKSKSDYFLFDHPDTMDIKDKIGGVLLGQLDYDNAVKTLSENYETRKVSLGANNIFTMSTKRQMAVALYHFGQKEAALKYLQDIYNKQLKVFGKSHSDVLKTQMHVARVLQRDDKDLEALKQYEIVDELRKEFCSEDLCMLIDVQANMAMILSKQNKHEDALEKLNFLYATIKEIPREEHLYSLEIISNMAHVYRRKEMSSFRAIANGDLNVETGNNFPDRDVFYWMVTYKKILSGIHIEYDDIEGM